MSIYRARLRNTSNGHVEHKNDASWLKHCMMIEINGTLGCWSGNWLFKLWQFNDLSHSIICIYGLKLILLTLF